MLIAFQKMFLVHFLLKGEENFKRVVPKNHTDPWLLKLIACWLWLCFK